MPLPLECDCEPESIVGPFDRAEVEPYERWMGDEYPHLVRDPSYLDYLERNHGGVPRRQWFTTSKGTVLRLGRFINYGEEYREPYIDSWESPGSDLRSHWSFGCVQGIANIGEGCGAFLIPFGILYSGPHHPDEMKVNYADLVCFDYSKVGRPEVVVWFNHLAVDELFRCEGEGLDPLTEMDHSRFTEPVAREFESFMLSLRETSDGT